MNSGPINDYKLEMFLQGALSGKVRRQIKKKLKTDEFTVFSI